MTTHACQKEREVRVISSEEVIEQEWWVPNLMRRAGNPVLVEKGSDAESD